MLYMYFILGPSINQSVNQSIFSRLRYAILHGICFEPWLLILQVDVIAYKTSWMHPLHHLYYIYICIAIFALHSQPHRPQTSPRLLSNPAQKNHPVYNDSRHPAAPVLLSFLLGTFNPGPHLFSPARTAFSNRKKGGEEKGEEWGDSEWMVDDCGDNKIDGTVLLHFVWRNRYVISFHRWVRWRRPKRREWKTHSSRAQKRYTRMPGKGSTALSLHLLPSPPLTPFFLWSYFCQWDG